MKYDPGIEQYGISLVDEHTVRKKTMVGSLELFMWISALLNHFIKHPDPMVVPIYKFEELKIPRGDRYGDFNYAYEMQRLGKLDKDEREIITQYRENGMMNSPVLLRGAREYPNLLKFLKILYFQGRYIDIHNRNIMKDEEGNYRVIDIEGFGPTTLSDPRNDWITR